MAAPATRDFDPGRISPGETIAGGAGIALFLFLFLHWFDGASAWATFDVVDFLLAAIALLAVGVAGAHAMGNDPLGRNTGTVLAVAGIVATSIILTFVLEGDGRKIGLYLAFLAAISLAYGGWRTMHEAPGTPGPLAGAGGFGGSRPPSSPTEPTTPMATNAPGAPRGGPESAAAADPVPGQTSGQTPPGLVGEPPPGEGTHPPGL
jgi:hypothetical protein